MKHSNVFYKRNTEGQYDPLEVAKAVRNKAGFDLFRVRFDLYEGSTGLMAKSHGSMEELQSTINHLGADTALRTRYEKAIAENRERYGLSPRYTRPHEKYAELFPPPEKKDILSSTLSGEKHYFFEVYNEDGIALYVMKKQKRDPWDYLYLLYEGWMLNVGNLIQMDIRVEEFKKGMPNFRQIMTDKLDAALAEPDKWADPEFANFLGRREEADAHNQPILEVRRAEWRHQWEERARREEEERLQEQREYEAAIFDAEQAVLNKRELYDEDVRGTSLILHLFRQNGVDLPLKTQGWVKSSLVRLFYSEDSWSYSYRGRESTVFFGYLQQLAEAIEKKYEQQPEVSISLEPDNELEI